MTSHTHPYSFPVYYRGSSAAPDIFDIDLVEICQEYIVDADFQKVLYPSLPEASNVRVQLQLSRYERSLATKEPPTILNCVRILGSPDLPAYGHFHPDDYDIWKDILGVAAVGKRSNTDWYAYPEPGVYFCPICTGSN
jgi:hypothetical protein